GPRRGHRGLPRLLARRGPARGRGVDGRGPAGPGRGQPLAAGVHRLAPGQPPRPGAGGPVGGGGGRGWGGGGRPWGAAPPRGGGGGARATMVGLRVGVLVMLLAIFLPQLRLHFERQGWPDVVLILDDSHSMSALDVYRDAKVKAAADALADKARLSDEEQARL